MNKMTDLFKKTGEALIRLNEQMSNLKFPDESSLNLNDYDYLSPINDLKTDIELITDNQKAINRKLFMMNVISATIGSIVGAIVGALVTALLL